ncbi:MAG: molybdopterin-dependent oxidoreductase, partial [Thermodesulfovibrionales bacterium]|nr:molybdopterin-dependent oxidoreductase [Thermodesulfovibrionales bacterium]
MESKKIIISPINLREDRLPPGQRWIENPIPYDITEDTNFSSNDYALEFYGEVEKPLKITYQELLLTFPQVELITDFHCVTHWSVREIHWEGVQVKELLKIVNPRSKYVLIYSKDGYTTNTLT